MPKVSILVPVFNAETCVERCLESIRNQTFGDFEVVCIDDGSTDRSPSLLDALCEADDRFICVHQENGGVAAARNAALGLAHGDFVMFVDCDDMLPKKALQFMHQVSVVQECDTIMGMYERVDGVTPYTNARSSHLVNKARCVGRDDLDIIHTWTLCNKWLSRRIIEEHNLRFDSLSHLEDAVFLYAYLAHADAICTCPHIVYTYIKPLPIAGRTTTQSINASLLDSAGQAFKRLQELTQCYGDVFEQELMYRYMNSPLVGDYYRRIWKLPSGLYEDLRDLLNGYLARLDAEHRTRISWTNRDFMTEEGVWSKRRLLDSPQVVVAIAPDVSSKTVAGLVEGLYDQSFISFRVLVAGEHRSSVPESCDAMPNLGYSDGDVFQEARSMNCDFTAFIDSDMLYDHRSLMTMVRCLEKDEGLDFVALQPKTPGAVYAEPNPTIKRSYDDGEVDADRFLANKLFRTSSISGLPLDMDAFFHSLSYKRLDKPAMISFVPEERFDPTVIQRWEEEERARVEKERRDANPLRRVRRKIGRVVRRGQKVSKPRPKPAHRKTIDYYLNEEVDRTLVVLEGLGKRLRGNMLYILRELQRPEYAHYTVLFSVTEQTREESRGMLARMGLEHVETIVAGSDEYKAALFSAGYLFNEVDFPNWWVKKPAQVYVNIWHGTPLKTLGKAKSGSIHNDANAARNFTMADFILLPNEHTRRHLLGDCDVDELVTAKRLYLGYPRTGQLFDEKTRAYVRAGMGLGDLQVYAWMPTYRDELTIACITGFLQHMEMLLDDRHVMFVNLHHKTAAAIDFSQFERIRPFPRQYDTYEFLCATDALVTDYSSIMFDYSVTRRPIVLYCPDRELYAAARGFNIDISSLPFPVVEGETQLYDALLAGRQYDDGSFLHEFNRYDSEKNAEMLCSAVFQDKFEGVEVVCNEQAGPVSLIVSDALRPSMATDLLYEMAECARWPRDTYLSFLEQEVDRDPSRAYPLVRNVPIFATKGSQLSERTEQQRLYNNLKIKRVIVLDTVSNARIRAFARFDVPVHLCVQRELVDRIACGDDETIKALKLFERWGDGLFALEEGAAHAVAELTGAEVACVSSFEAFLQLLDM